MEGQEKVEKKPEMGLVVGIQYRTAGDVYTFITGIEDLKQGDFVAVEGEHGESVGMIIILPHEVPSKEIPKNVKKVVRRANDEDMKQYIEGREKAREYCELCEQKVQDHNLPMKLVDAELVEGGKKIIFFFFAEQRVDFRALVKDLAGSLHRYIEMRQIGSRDAASFIGCMGPCGRTTCCSLYLRQFQSISIAMAKNQGLSPNPAKLTGMCGKLKCCLAYENKTYSDARKGLPKLGSWVTTPKGEGKLTGLDVLKRVCSVRFEEGGETRLPCSECKAAQKVQKERGAEKRPQRRSKRSDKKRKGDNE
jgi:cell fate regulator YaaT (PSP1 superfamily)